MIVWITLYPYLKIIHHTLAWTGVYVGLILFAVAFHLGVMQKRDVTRLFRRSVYALAALMVVQMLLGTAIWYGVGTRPIGEAHWIYGVATAAAIPYFAFIETTAEKRPAMGSYLWGLGMLAAIGFRSILTGG